MSSVFCVFCKRDDTVIYEVNQNSILIEKDLFDIDDLISDLFMRRIDQQQMNHICEECKDQLVQFYIFKINAKKCLPETEIDILFDQLSKFVCTNKDKNFDVKYSECSFSVSADKPPDVYLEENEEIMYMEFDTNEVEGEEEMSMTDEYFQPTTEDSDLIEEITDIKENETIHFESFVTNHTVTCECGLSFNGIKELQAHTTSEHKKKSSQSMSGSYSFYAGCCGILLKDKKYLKMHQNAHESFNAILPYLQLFKCEECQVHYSNDKDLESHKKAHENGTVDPLILYERVSAFEDHFGKQKKSSNANDQTKGPICGHCGKRKSTEIEVQSHIFIFHTTFIECPLENRNFEGNKQIRLFIDHVKNKHPEIFDSKVEYTCTYCEAKFPSLFERLAHMKTCDAKKFICTSHCGKRFKTEWLLNRHIQLVEEGDDRFKCGICSKLCTSKSDLQIHMRSHTNERPYVCTICEKAFKTSANRSSHMDIHKEEKVHECNVCLEKFQTRPILRKHRKIHDVDYQKQCICRICNKSYINRTHLLRHIKSMHADNNLPIDQIDKFFENYLAKNIMEH